MSFELSSILWTVDLSKHLITAWIIQKFYYGVTPIQTMNFSFTKPNAYITSILN